MFDADTRTTASLQPRAEGAVRVSAVDRRGASRLGRLEQRGSAKVLLPRRRGRALEAVLLNTAGGMTGGDRFSWAAEAEAGTDLVLTTQAAERIYRAQPGEIARVETRLTLGPGARLHWLPQETIVFDRAAVARTLAVEMSADAELVLHESVVLGRAAMGERVGACRFRDAWRVRRGGRLVFADALRVRGETECDLGGPATLGRARAVALVLLVAPDAEDRLAAVRALLAHEAVAAGASAFDGCLVVRLMAGDGYRLAPAVARAAGLLRAPCAAAGMGQSWEDGRS